MSNTEFKQINWKQGMSVSSSHFIATENFMLERLMQTARIFQNRFYYGLLPMQTEDPSMSISIVGTNEYAKVVLNSYHGITQGGYLVDYESNTDSVSCACVTDGQVSEQGWEIVLSVEPFDRNPCGEPDMRETPPRYPFVEPSYKLSVVAREKSYINHYGPYDVVVGVLLKNDNTYRLDSSFIPPSLSMNSTSELTSFMKEFSKSIASIKNSVSTIMEKAYIQAEANNRTTIMINILEICKDLQRSLTSLFFKWHNFGMSLTPYEVVELVANLAGTVSTSLTFFKKSEREEIQKYFHEWNGIQPSSFDQVLSELVTNEFQQNRISNSIVLAQRVLRMLEELFVSLSRLDYVGQHKETIVIGVKDVEQNPNNKTSWLEL